MDRRRHRAVWSPRTLVRDITPDTPEHTYVFKSSRVHLRDHVKPGTRTDAKMVVDFLTCGRTDALALVLSGQHACVL